MFSNPIIELDDHNSHEISDLPSQIVSAFAPIEETKATQAYPLEDIADLADSEHYLVENPVHTDNIAKKDEFTLEYHPTFDQRALTALLRKFNLKSDLIGVCAGVGIQGLFAILASDVENLIARINFIKKQENFLSIHKNFLKAQEKKQFFMQVARRTFHETFCEENKITIKMPTQLLDLLDTDNFLNYLKSYHPTNLKELRKLYFSGLKKSYSQIEDHFEKSADYLFIDVAIYLHVIDILADLDKYEDLTTELTCSEDDYDEDSMYETFTEEKEDTQEIEDNISMSAETTGDPARFYWKLLLPNKLFTRQIKTINGENYTIEKPNITFIASKSGVYTRDEFLLLFEILKSSFLETRIRTPVAFLLSSGTHMISVGLIPKRDPLKGWVVETPLIDANNFDLLTCKMDSEALADNLPLALCSYNSVALCEMELFAHNKDRVLVKQWFDIAMKSSAIKHMHSIHSFVKMPKGGKLTKKWQLEDSEGYSWLSIALSAHDTPTFKAIIEMKPTIGKEGIDSDYPLTSLIHAVSEGVEAVRDILSCAGVDATYINRIIENTTALSIALSNDEWEIVELLLDKSADITLCTEKFLNEYLLDKLILANKKMLFNSVLATGKIDVNKKWTSSFPLELKNSDAKEAYNFLKQYRVDPNEVKNWSLLHTSIIMGNKYMVSALLAANATLTTSTGSIPVLMLAKFLRYHHIEYLLLTHMLTPNEFNQGILAEMNKCKNNFRQLKALHEIYKNLSHITERHLKWLPRATKAYHETADLLKKAYGSVCLSPEKSKEIMTLLEQKLDAMIGSSSEQKIIVKHSFTLLPDSILQLSRAKKYIINAFSEISILMQNKKYKRSSDYKLLVYFANKLQDILNQIQKILTLNNPLLARNLLAKVESFLKNFYADQQPSYEHLKTSPCLNEIVKIYHKYIKIKAKPTTTQHKKIKSIAFEFEIAEVESDDILKKKLKI